MSNKRGWILLGAGLLGALYLVEWSGSIERALGTMLIPGFHTYSCLIPGEQGEATHGMCVAGDGVLATMAAYGLGWIAALPAAIPFVVAWFLTKE